MIEQFDEIARGASELRVNLLKGDIVVRVVEGAAWSLDGIDKDSAEPEIERIGPAVEIRQRGWRARSSGRAASGATFKGAFAGHSGIVGEVMSEVGGIVDEVGGVVDDVMSEVLGVGGLRGGREIRLTIPTGVELVELSTGWGSIKADGLRGRLRLSTGFGPLSLREARGEGELSTGSGDVTIERYDGRLTASSGNGKVRLERLGGEARLNTGNGRVEITESEGTVRAHTGNGAVVLTAASGEAELHTGHGGIEISAARGLTAEAKTGAGSIQVEGGSVRSLRLNSTMGPVRVAADLAPGSYDLSSGMGGITVELPDDAQARVDAQTGFGQVHSDFPLVRVGRSGPLGFGAVRMVGSIGTGDPQVELALRSGKGDLVLRRAVTPSRLPAPPRPPAPPDAPPAGRAPGNSAASYDSTLSILESLARGEITPAQAEDLLSGAGRGQRAESQAE